MKYIVRLGYLTLFLVLCFFNIMYICDLKNEIDRGNRMTEHYKERYYLAVFHPEKINKNNL